MAVHADRLRPTDDPGHARALAAAAVLRSIYERASELLRTDWTEAALRGPRQRDADGGLASAPAATRTVHPMPPYGLDGSRRLVTLALPLGVARGLLLPPSLSLLPRRLTCRRLRLPPLLLSRPLCRGRARANALRSL